MAAGDILCQPSNLFTNKAWKNWVLSVRKNVRKLSEPGLKTEKERLATENPFVINRNDEFLDEVVKQEVKKKK